jgi:putative membrane-bound dehydrogenase-like protein
MMKICSPLARLFAAACLGLFVFLAADQPTQAADPPARTAPEDESFFFIPPGFEKEGRPLTAGGEGTGKLAIIVRDKSTGKPTPCRINVVGMDGNYYQPSDNRLSKYAMTGQWPEKKAWGNRKEKAPWRYLGRYFYSTGEASVDVPAGAVRVEVSKGFEYAPQVAQTTAAKGKTTGVEVALERTVPMAPFGYFGGDPHLHFARVGEQDDETIFDLLEADDVWYGTPLGYNEPAGPYAGFMDKMDSPQFRGLGAESVKSRGSIQILSGQEYRSATFGHLNLYLRDRLVFEGQNFNTDDGPAYGIVGAETQAQGGIAIHAHGGYGLEIYADAALGTVNAVELLQFGIYRGIGLTDWYHMLNAGYRFPAVGASDFPACRFMSDCRTYVWSDAKANGGRREQTKPDEAPRAPDFAEWLRAAARGQSFVTTGPLLLLEVEGARPGQIANFEGARPRNVTARVRIRCEVTPVHSIELIVNGKPVKLFQGVVKGAWSEFQQPLTLNESSWIAARAYSTAPGGQPDAESHTNPVYVYLDGKAPYAQASLDAWLAQIDKQIEVHTKRTFAGKPQVLVYFQRARDTLLKIRERGGLRTEENPAELLRSATGDERSAPSTDLAGDGSQRNPTDDELREFLKPVPPRSPEGALKSLEVASGFHAELVAAEPLVRSPVAAAFDEDGNLYVCEMRDYPFKPVEGAKPIGSVRLLRDTDGDGRFDEAHIFADELLWAAGVAPWKGGVFVAAPPDVWYMKDIDGDFKADIKRRVFTGFGLENQQAMLNNLQFWLDHKIYGSTAGNGGEIRPGDNPAAARISVKGRDFRFDPRTERFETITGTVQFGNTFDDWGNRFVCSESQPLEHIVLPEEFLVRNPFLATPSAINNVAPGPVPIFRISPIERWRHIRSSRRIAKNERAAASAGASHHVVDAAAGVTIYRGGAYPSEYYGQVFVGDGQNNLVHRRSLVRDGVTFQSHRLDEKTEFVRSSDIWFRPVNFLNAPDGTLYCLDMSREVLESIHIPLDVVKHLDLASGRNSGRIYRISPDGFRAPKPPRLSRAASAELVAALESPHGWWRDTAHRLIYERQDKAVAPALVKLARESRLPQARLCALWSLAGLDALDGETLAAALRDPQAGVRENAVLLARAERSESSVAELARVPGSPNEPEFWRIPLRELLPLADDESPRVRFQLAFMLGYAGDGQKPAAAQVLAQLARRDGGDRWMRAAILSSASESAADLFQELIRGPAPGRNGAKNDFAVSEAGSAILAQLAGLIGARHRRDEIDRTLIVLAEAAPIMNATADQLLLELARGLRRAGARLEFAGESSTAGDWLKSKLSAATAAVAAESGENVPDAERIRAIELMGAAYLPGTRELLLGLIRSDQSDSVQIAAIRGLSNDTDSRIASELLSRFNSLTPDVRRAALDALLSREERILALLEAGSRDEVSLADIEPTRRDVLLKHKNAAIRRLAEQVFSASGTRGRKEVLAEYQAVLKLPAKAADGQAIFEKNCAVCHQLAGKGYAIGPNLTSSSVRDPAVLLAHILDPNQYLLPNYVQYVVLDKQGRSYSGLLASQTATSITLKKEKDETVTILRGEIEELANSGKSLMPEGLEKNIPPQEMADLLAYLQEAAAASPGDPNAERDFGTLPGLIEPKREP